MLDRLYWCCLWVNFFAVSLVLSYGLVGLVAGYISILLREFCCYNGCLLFGSCADNSCGVGFVVWLVASLGLEFCAGLLVLIVVDGAV